MSGAENAERIVCVVRDNTLSELSLDVRQNNIAGAESHNTTRWDYNQCDLMLEMSVRSYLVTSRSTAPNR